MTAAFGIIVLLGPQACSDPSVGEGLPVAQPDAGGVLLDGRPPLPPDSRPDRQPRPSCGDHICQEPLENLITCPRDCRPQPFAYQEQAMRPDPGYIDPPLDSPIAGER